ncbi:MAG TPA: PQQ-dependent sugar dehydrogenase [Polyangiaceae bacterium]|nr:PQQ-dependent sugar dehydrogenase [Polyangiaceae bacterium]
MLNLLVYPWRALLVLLLVLCAAPVARAAVSDASFTESPYAKLKTMITGIGWAPDATGRLFAIRQNGVVEVIENGVAAATPFATIDPVHAIAECGLLGFAFDSGFSDNGFIYFFVTVTAAEQQIIRYRAQGNLGVEKTVIISGLPAKDTYHCGGGIGFGADGKLYWSTGDLGIYLGVDDDLTSLGAKVGRANADGTVPKDNPFFDGPGPNNDYVWASGFRSPFSLTFDPAQERLWVSVAGTLYEQVFTPTAGSNAGWDDYENNQPPGYLSPTIAYRTGQAEVRDIVSAQRQSGLSTFATSVPHGFRAGTKLTVAGVADASFNGAGYVATTPSPTEFSLSQSGGAASAVGGTATTLDIGRAITGGTFWDSSAVPPEYRGNFFFGDYVSGNIVRTRLDASSTPLSVDLWGTYKLPTDMAVGPDGALYYSSYGSAVDGGTIARASYMPKGQGIVVSPLHVRVPESVDGYVHVRLALPPSGAVAVQTSRMAGDADVSIVQGAALSFDSVNWMVPQPIRVRGAKDADAVDDEAKLRVASEGLPAEEVIVRITDPGPVRMVVTPAQLAMTEGESRSVLVSLNGRPESPVSVKTQRVSGDVDVQVVSGETIVLDPTNWDVPQQVVVQAAEDADITDDAAFLSVTDGVEEISVSVNVADNDSVSDAGASEAGKLPSSAPSAPACGCRVVAPSPDAVPWPLALLVLGPMRLRRRQG